MMTEQQMTLKSDDLQDRWKMSILTTCYAYRVVERVKEAIDNLVEAVIDIINSLIEVFKPVVDILKTVWEDSIDFVEEHKEKSYQQSYPHNVDNLKVNTKGFQRPITHCARSRC